MDVDRKSAGQRKCGILYTSTIYKNINISIIYKSQSFIKAFIKAKSLPSFLLFLIFDLFYYITLLLKFNICD